MTQQGRIFLGMPNAGHAYMHAARGYFHACRDMSRVVKYHPANSLLASNFNDIWCCALNHAADNDGEQLSYFAMLHSDVAPENFWLDKLIAELEANELDILSAAVPIKDNRGITSMALHREGDNWLPFARLSMREVFTLPKTFTSEDVGRPLLLNTGCWVIRWNQAMCEQLHFEVRDRIVFNTANNRWQSQTEPEDWFFSRNAHALGLKLGATRAVSLVHFGDTGYQNDTAWGQFPFDLEALSESSLPKKDRDGFSFPHDVDGWLTFDEGKALWKLGHGLKVLEIGSYCGRSTICLAQSAAHVTSVDPHDGRGTPRPKDTFSEIQENVTRYGLVDKVDYIIGTVDDVPPSKYDLIFIDGSHEYEDVRHDIDRALALLEAGGVLAFHDYRERPGQHDGRWDPGVTQAVKELIASGGELVSTHDSLAVVQPLAAIPLEV